MKINDIKNFSVHALGVKAPWRVAAVSILGVKRRVEPAGKHGGGNPVF